MRSAEWSKNAVSWVGSHPALVDLALTMAVTVAAVAPALGDEHAGWRQVDALGLVLIATTSLPNLARRRAPMSAMVLCCAASLCYAALGYYPGSSGFGPELAWYGLAASRPPKRAWPGAIMLAALWAYSDIAGRAMKWPAALAVGTAVTIVLWVFAGGWRLLGIRNRQLADLTEQLRHEQDFRARQAVARERVRIARELHDVVAHHMSVISVQAGLARYVLTSEPDTADRALHAIADTSTEGLHELRRMLTLLRVDSDSVDPNPANGSPPGMRDLVPLLERVRRAGLPVESTVSGTARDLPPGLELCAYRVVQESLTNVLKHAHGAVAHVEVAYAAESLTVRVRNDGPAAAPAAHSGSSGGNGLAGMRERAALYNGSLQAASRPDGGFEVELRLPVPFAPLPRTAPDLTQGQVHTAEEEPGE